MEGTHKAGTTAKTSVRIRIRTKGPGLPSKMMLNRRPFITQPVQLYNRNFLGNEIRKHRNQINGKWLSMWIFTDDVAMSTQGMETLQKMILNLTETSEKAA